MPGGQDNRNPYDIHFYFNELDSQSIKEAQDIQNDFAKNFSWATIFPLVKRPVGPHPIGMWEAHFTNCPKDNVQKEREKVIEWFEKNRKGHQVLIHPNTDNVVRDHTDSTYWVSNDPVELNIDIIRRFVQNN